MITLSDQILQALRIAAKPEKVAVLSRFFKTGKGQYGEGDRFLGVMVPQTRQVARQFKDVPLCLVEELLSSEWHECRLCALLILIEKYKNTPVQEIVDFYLAHTRGVNNWDLVDLSAPYLLGQHLLSQEDHSVLYRLAQSSVLWEQRIAMVSTLMLIRNGKFEDTINLAEFFIDARHDLMQKAVGWMLREVGKRDELLLINFLNSHSRKMPRTMLRYAVERLVPEKRPR